MTSFSKLLFTGFIATQAFNFATATTDDLCYCVGECKSLADPHVTKFDGTSYDIYTEGETTLYNIGETYAVKSFVTKLNGTGESYFQNEVTIIKNGVVANKYIADDTEDCPYQTHKISNEFAIENPFNELTEYVKTTLECKRGPINCQGSECMNYFNVYIEKKNYFRPSSSAYGKSFIEIEEEIVQADGDCLYLPVNNVLTRAATPECWCPSTKTPTGTPTTATPTLAPTPEPTLTPTKEPTLTPTVTIAPSSIAPTLPSKNCFCSGKCSAQADPHIVSFDGAEFTAGSPGVELDLYDTDLFQIKGLPTGNAEKNYFNRITINGTVYSSSMCKYSKDVIANVSFSGEGQNIFQEFNAKVTCTWGPPNCDPAVTRAENPMNGCDYYLNAFVTKSDYFDYSDKFDIYDFMSVENFLNATGQCMKSHSTISDKPDWNCTCVTESPTSAPTLNPNITITPTVNPNITLAPTGTPTQILTVAPTTPPPYVPSKNLTCEVTGDPHLLCMNGQETQISKSLKTNWTTLYNMTDKAGNSLYAAVGYLESYQNQTTLEYVTYLTKIVNINNGVPNSFVIAADGVDCDHHAFDSTRSVEGIYGKSSLYFEWPKSSTNSVFQALYMTWSCSNSPIKHIDVKLNKQSVDLAWELTQGYSGDCPSCLNNPFYPPSDFPELPF